MTVKLTELNEQEIALLREPQLAHLATINPDGTPQITPLWIDTDGHDIIFNTAKGRIKHRNLVFNPHVAVSVADRNDPYRTCIAQGTVEFVDEGADEHIDFLAHKYLGVDRYPMRTPSEERVIGHIHITNLIRRK